MQMHHTSGWHFIDKSGTFELLDPQRSSHLYFPLVNPMGMMSSITPTLRGDAKTGQNSYLLCPVSVEDLHNTRSGRNFWLLIDGVPWSIADLNSPFSLQTREEKAGNVIMQAGFLWHTIKHNHPTLDLCTTVTNFVPIGDDDLELMRVSVCNTGDQALNIIPVAAVPIFARSADNLRDHRHVTSLLHRTSCNPYGVVVKPTMSFDERGHVHNQTNYAVLGVGGDGSLPKGFYPTIAGFIGEGGNLERPQAIFDRSIPVKPAGVNLEGYESLGGIEFPELKLHPGQTVDYILLLGIFSTDQSPKSLIDCYGSGDRFDHHLQKTRDFWQDKLSGLYFEHENGNYDGWLRWVTLQPFLRRFMGNSFLPYHDYGRGGRGWRDLWQDMMALLLTEGSASPRLILDNFAGVRIDGSNATIVGKKTGEFIADRNSIPRVWMDHGVWPLMTTKLYLDLTGELDLLLENQTYFQDHLTHRCQKVDRSWQLGKINVLTSNTEDPVLGTVLEHLLVQHLTAFFNVGEHNIIRLEGADWNDGLDMAAERGESVAFSAFYAGNLQILSDLCLALEAKGKKDISIATEILLLLDRISKKIDYASISAKRSLLNEYLDRVSRPLSGDRQSVKLKDLAKDLSEKSKWLADHILKQEWVQDEQGMTWFNGYYDNRGDRLEGRFNDVTRMTLTGQVFPLMKLPVSREEAINVVRTVQHYLYDRELHGYRLNTNFGTNLPELGRAFSFAYGHKENGSSFNHMAVMYAYALYKHDLVEAGWRVLEGIYFQSQDFEKSHMYPGIPEYFDPQGRGMYPYLTGSAAWYLFTLLTQAFGVKGQLGDLILMPKLLAEQFPKSNRLVVSTQFAGKRLHLTYMNPGRFSFGDYCFRNLLINGIEHPIEGGKSWVCFTRDEVLAWPDDVHIDITLDRLP